MNLLGKFLCVCQLALLGGKTTVSSVAPTPCPLNITIQGQTILLNADQKVFNPNKDLERYGLNLLNTALPHIKKDSRVLVMGSGSGLEAIAIAKLTGAKVVGADIVPEAKALAEKNALLNGVEGQVEFVTSDLFQNVEGKFDFILFNAPAPVTLEILSKRMPPLQAARVLKSIKQTSTSYFDPDAKILTRFLGALPNHMHDNSTAFLMSDVQMPSLLPPNLQSGMASEPSPWSLNFPNHGSFAIHGITLKK